MASTAAPVVDKTDGLDLLGVQADAAVLKMLVKQNPRGTKCVSSRALKQTWNPHQHNQIVDDVFQSMNTLCVQAR